MPSTELEEKPVKKETVISVYLSVIAYVKRLWNSAMIPWAFKWISDISQRVSYRLRHKTLGKKVQSLIRWNSIRFPWKCKCLLHSLLMRFCCFFVLLQWYFNHGFADLRCLQHWGQFNQHHCNGYLLGAQGTSVRTDNLRLIWRNRPYTTRKP